jgi:hypothetical protein
MYVLPSDHGFIGSGLEVTFEVSKIAIGAHNRDLGVALVEDAVVLLLVLRTATGIILSERKHQHTQARTDTQSYSH